MTCDPESVTAYVDRFLYGADLARMEAHLADCPACREQAEAERELRARLKGLPAPEPRPALEGEVRQRIRSSRRRRGLWLVPLAAGLTALALLGRGSPTVVAWEASRDHAHCFGQKRLPAQVWSNDPATVSAWFERQGTAMPPLPVGAGGLQLLGARYCPFPDATLVPHVYYSSAEGQLSVFLIPRRLRLKGSFVATTRGTRVGMLTMNDSTLALVSENPAQVETFQRLFATRMATLVIAGDSH
ncbi:MAG TPA: zf-HC2 domain-containing protein [Vicinamibacteria bacterium]|nr:zf-HC2 domain-containing protein [Vicinamibacteria bacterium]